MGEDTPPRRFWPVDTDAETPPRRFWPVDRDENTPPKRTGGAHAEYEINQGLREATNDLRSNGYHLEILSQVKKALSVNTEKTSGPIDVVCLCLGHFYKPFETIIGSVYQLALLEFLREKLSAQRCLIYDPDFTEKEKEWLSSKSYDVLEENEKCLKTRVSANSTNPTLYFMPHCYYGLYRDVLYSNWSAAQLKRVVILGNSLSELDDRMGKTVSYGVFGLIRPALYEQKLPPFITTTTKKGLEGVFDTTSVSVFRMNDISSDAWECKPQKDPLSESADN